MPDLPIEVMVAISVISSVLVFLLKLLFTSKGKVVPAWVYSVLLFGISLVVTAIGFPVQIPEFPPYSDLPSGIVAALQFLGELIPILSAFVGAAITIYQLLLKRVLEGLETLIKKAVSPAGSDIG